MRKAVLAGVALLCVLAVAACGDDNSSSSTSTAATSTPVAATGPAINALAGPAEVSCSTDEATVPLTWATSNATAVEFSVDGQPVPAGAGYPTTGRGNVAVPCDNGTHEVTLTATGDGSISESVTVGTVQKEKPVTRPIIRTMSAPGAVTCAKGDTAEVKLTWTTESATAVEITVDDQPLPADAGQPVNGSSDVPVPCDGKVHAIGLIAYGQGTSAASYVVKVQTNTAEPTAPSITAFSVPAEVACTAGQTTEVAAEWTTTNAQGVSFEVDGQPLSAAAGFPASGSGNVPVPCDNREHTITISTSGGGTTVSRTLTVDMVAKTAPVLRPAISVFTMPVRVPCTVNPRPVVAKYRTSNANYIAFQLDGVAIPKLGTLPLNGAVKLPIPCDGTQHKITLVAEGQGNSIATITRPITALPQGTVTAEETTTAP